METRENQIARTLEEFLYYPNTYIEIYMYLLQYIFIHTHGAMWYVVYSMFERFGAEGACRMAEILTHNSTVQILKYVCINAHMPA
jgi:hypothetical protein